MCYMGSWFLHSALKRQSRSLRVAVASALMDMSLMGRDLCTGYCGVIIALHHFKTRIYVERRQRCLLALPESSKYILRNLEIVKPNVVESAEPCTTYMRRSSKCWGCVWRTRHRWNLCKTKTSLVLVVTACW